MRIAIGNDHAGVNEKNDIEEYLNGLGHIVTNFGTDKSDSVDYPDYAVLVAKSVSTGDNDLGIIICGSGNGVSIAANKVRGVRAALCYNEETAILARQHNNANVMTYGARFIDLATAKKMIHNFINTEFEGGRHQNRVSKIHSLTNC